MFRKLKKIGKKAGGRKRQDENPPVETSDSMYNNAPADLKHIDSDYEDSRALEAGDDDSNRRPVDKTDDERSRYTKSNLSSPTTRAPQQAPAPAPVVVPPEQPVQLTAAERKARARKAVEERKKKSRAALAAKAEGREVPAPVPVAAAPPAPAAAVVTPAKDSDFVSKLEQQDSEFLRRRAASEERQKLLEQERQREQEEREALEREEAEMRELEESLKKEEEEARKLAEQYDTIKEKVVVETVDSDESGEGVFVETVDAEKAEVEAQFEELAKQEEAERLRAEELAKLEAEMEAKQVNEEADETGISADDLLSQFITPDEEKVDYVGDVLHRDSSARLPDLDALLDESMSANETSTLLDDVLDGPIKFSPEKKKKKSKVASPEKKKKKKVDAKAKVSTRNTTKPKSKSKVSTTADNTYSKPNVGPKVDTRRPDSKPKSKSKVSTTADKPYSKPKVGPKVDTRRPDSKPKARKSTGSVSKKTEKKTTRSSVSKSKKSKETETKKKTESKPDTKKPEKLKSPKRKKKTEKKAPLEFVPVSEIDKMESPEKRPGATRISNMSHLRRLKKPPVTTRPRIKESASIDSFGSQCTFHSLPINPYTQIFPDTLTCNNKYIPNLHSKPSGCQVCIFKLSDAEKAQYEKNGRHLRVAMTTGGCSGCNIFPPGEGEDPVRICRKCFFDTHLIRAHKTEAFAGTGALSGVQKYRKNRRPYSTGVNRYMGGSSGASVC